MEFNPIEFEDRSIDMLNESSQIRAIEQQPIRAQEKERSPGPYRIVGKQGERFLKQGETRERGRGFAAKETGKGGAAW